MLSNLFKENSEVLFDRAMTATRSLDNVLCSPVPLTTECKMNPPCRHCWWRAMSNYNSDFQRLREPGEVIRRVAELANTGIHRILLPSGWLGYELPEWFYNYVHRVKEEIYKLDTNIEFFATCGPLAQNSLNSLKEAGLDGYWCGIEVPNEKLFHKVRPGDNFKARLETLNYVTAAGLKLWSGFLFGVGETEADIMWGLELMKSLPLDSFSLTPYKQYPFVEMEQLPSANLYAWARTAAIARIYLGTVNSFTSPDFITWGLRAGINSFLPVFPEQGQIELVSKMRSTFTRDKIYLENC